MYDYYIPLNIEKEKIIITDENDMTLPIKTPITINAFKNDQNVPLEPFSDFQRYVEVSVNEKYVFLPYNEIYNPQSFIHIKILDKKSIDRVEMEYFNPDKIYSQSFVLDHDSKIDFHLSLATGFYDSDGNLESWNHIPINMKNDYIKIFVNNEPWTSRCGLSCEFEKGTSIKYEVYNNFDISLKHGIICKTCRVVLNIY